MLLVLVDAFLLGGGELGAAPEALTGNLGVQVFDVESLVCIRHWEGGLLLLSLLLLGEVLGEITPVEPLLLGHSVHERGLIPVWYACELALVDVLCRLRSLESLGLQLVAVL